MRSLLKWKLKWKIILIIGIVGIISSLILVSIALGVSFPTVYDECDLCP